MSSYHHRFVEDRLKELWRHFPAVAVLGARQVGKSTLVRQVFRNKVKSIVLDPVQDVGGARADPDLFLQNNQEPLFLDEVQYVASLLPSLKRRMDAVQRPGQYLLSGSQNLMVMRGLAESLAGRVAILELPPMGFAEIEKRTAGGDALLTWLGGGDPVVALREPPPWSRAIWRGGHPRLLGMPDSVVQSYLESYVRTHVERDIRTVAAVSDLQLFGRFFGLLAAHTACEVNPSELGRELGVDRKTAKAWLSVAEATFQWLEVPAFSRNPAKRVSGKRKGYMVDTGLVCFHQRIPDPGLLPSHPLHGRLAETWVVMEIFKRSQAWTSRPGLWHYRAHTGAKVDLILEWGGRLFPIEVKAKAHPTRSDARGIAAFRADHPDLNIGPGLIVCAVTELQRLSPDLVAIPWWAL